MEKSGHLTVEQIRLFRHNGFLKHPNRLPQERVERLKEGVWKDIRGEAGGMLIIDSLIFHGAGKNRTDDTRMSMTVGYHSVDELSKVENPQQILVRGEQIYLGSEY